ncbi:hypothetical protein CRUP_012383, partial [Coryphaenoides rupestris]
MYTTPVSEEFQNGEGFGYIVAFRANGTRGWKEKMVTSADSTTYKYRDETFPPLTPFEVKVGVYNNKGDGPFSAVVTVVLGRGREAPSDVKASGISASEVRVTWRPPNPGPGRPERYEVSFWKDLEQQEESGSKRQTVRNETSVVLSGLDGNSLYHVTVRGFNTIGQGPASAATTAQTRKTQALGGRYARSNRVDSNATSAAASPRRQRRRRAVVAPAVFLLPGDSGKLRPSLRRGADACANAFAAEAPWSGGSVRTRDRPPVVPSAAHR